MNLSDRMKLYERLETSRRFLPKLPVVARLDGRSFHSFTRGLARPFDERMSNLMVEVARLLVEETGARVGYTQSDEITLLFYSDDVESQIYFDGKIFKMTSVLASITTAQFNRLLSEFIPEKSDGLPVFDCRVWSVPSKEEAANVLIWREQDATRNSISAAAQSCYSHNQLDAKDSSAMQEMLFRKDINWNDYPAFFKRGVYIQRHKITRRFTTAEIDKLPPKHNARLNPDLEVERSEVRILDMPPLVRTANRIEIIFDGATPVSESERLTPPPRHRPTRRAAKGRDVMDDYWTKLARRYWASWKRHYGANPENIADIDVKVTEAIRRALVAAHRAGQRVGERNRVNVP